MTAWSWRGLALCAALLAGCASTPSAEREPALWAVRDADSTLYLYGTIHLRKAGDRWGGPSAVRALAEAQDVWTEVEVDPARDSELQALVARYGIDPARTLSSRLTPERARQFEAGAARLGLPVAYFEPMQPWFASVTFSVLPMRQAGYDPQFGVDRTVDRLAEAAGKRMRWFETGEAQLRFFSGLPEPVQIEMLEDSLDELEQGSGVMSRLESAWEIGDDRALARGAITDLKRERPALYDVVFTRRNAAWTEILAQELAGEGVDFVAVGAGHLVGPDSVIAMLRARGFAVERVSPRP